MIADLAPVSATSSRATAEAPTDLADVAFVWATLNALDCVDVAPADAPVIRAAHETFRQHLDDVGITSVDLFEHIADAVDRGDWAALGIADEPD